MNKAEKIASLVIWLSFSAIFAASRGGRDTDGSDMTFTMFKHRFVANLFFFAILGILVIAFRNIRGKK
ncbi:MAG: hypothetical protein JWM68_1811 [Verrucomicrobiales bacterium]|nr:hypothetical protein [Verrucomicrobiales bacterium]